MTERNEGTLCSAPQVPSLQKEEPLPRLLSEISSSELALCIPTGCDHLHCSGSLGWPPATRAPMHPGVFHHPQGLPCFFSPFCSDSMRVVASGSHQSHWLCGKRRCVPFRLLVLQSLFPHWPAGEMLTSTVGTVPGRQSTGSLSKGFGGRHS